MCVALHCVCILLSPVVSCSVRGVLHCGVWYCGVWCLVYIVLYCSVLSPVVSCLRRVALNNYSDNTLTITLTV